MRSTAGNLGLQEHTSPQPVRGEGREALCLPRDAGGQAAAPGHTSAWLLVSLLESRSPDSGQGCSPLHLQGSAEAERSPKRSKKLVPADSKDGVNSECSVGGGGAGVEGRGRVLTAVPVARRTVRSWGRWRRGPVLIDAGPSELRTLFSLLLCFPYWAPLSPRQCLLPPVPPSTRLPPSSFRARSTLPEGVVLSGRAPTGPPGGYRAPDLRLGQIRRAVTLNYKPDFKS